MNRTILYYPTINIPNDIWLRNALMYWDEVSSIVPQKWNDDFMVDISPEIHYLMDEGQFRPISPEKLFMNGSWELVNEFRDEFRNIMESENFQHKPIFNKIHKNKIDFESKIHISKISYEIFEFLKDKGLAIKKGDYDEWFYCEEKTALLYMSLLAKYLADIDSESTTIGTDNPYYEKYNFKRVSSSKGFPIINLSINKILPTPIENVPFEKIIDFKRRRRDNLVYFKSILSDFQIKMSQSESNSELKAIAIDFEEKLVKEVKDLVDTLNDSKIKYGLKSLRTLMSLKSPTTITTLGTIVNRELNVVNIPISMSVLGITAMAGIEFSIKCIEKRNEQRAILRNSPFSYIYYAQKSGIIKNPK